jgi:hypothetical protein
LPTGYNLTEKEGQKIAELIGQDLSYCEVGRRLGINRNTITKWCKKNGYARKLPDHYRGTIEANKKRSATIKRAYDKQNTFICKHCGETYIRRRRVGNEGKQYCCREHAFADWHNIHGRSERINGYLVGASNKVYFPICKVCLIPFTAHQKNQEVCSKECRMELNRRMVKTPEVLKQKRIKYRKENKLSLIKRKCIYCDEDFNTWYPKKRTCSTTCSIKYSRWRFNQTFNGKQSRLERNRRYQIRKRTNIIEVFKDIEIFIRDGWKCKICKKKVNKKAKVPNPKAPTIDHIIPLSCGGTHEKKNVQLACFKCNCTKSNGTIKGGEQLLMFG